MGTVYEFGFGSHAAHAGYTARLLPNGKLTSKLLDRRDFTAYVAACACGWHGTAEYRVTKRGEQDAIEEWRAHVVPLLPVASAKSARAAASAVVSRFEDAAIKGAPEAIAPLVAVAALTELASVVEAYLYERVRDARQAGASWTDLAKVLGVSRQATRMRFGDVRDR